jgi:UPF0755 protein
MRRALLIASLAVVAALVSGAAGLAWLRGYLASPLAIPAGDYTLQIDPGMPLSAVTARLADEDVLRHPRVLALWGRWTGDAGRIRAGEYRLMQGLTPGGLLEQLVKGQVLLHSLTLVEGWNVREIMQAISRHPALVRTLQTDEPDQLASELDLEFKSAEGAFFPDTYHFTRGTPDRELLGRAHATLMTQLDEAWTSRDPEVPLASAYELLILASIVEKETALASERPLIAGVFSRRLQRGMRLQTDPSVIYGLGRKFDGNLTRAHLAADTPWNTYTRDGLPPTPIAAAGAGALRAAARPAAGGSLYFVATGEGDGSHTFSDTLEQHNRAVRAYLARLRQRNQRSR